MFFNKASTLLALIAAFGPSFATAAGSLDCGTAFQDCLERNNFPGAVDYCARQHASCVVCGNQEDACRAEDAATNYSNSIYCTQQAQACYHEAFGIGTVNGAYSCAQARDTCNTARGTTHSFCAAQFAQCEPCIQQEDDCRTAPNANMAYCSSQGAQCYSIAISLTSS